ncbi:HAD family hydrolase [Paramesorhizobium deserti]|uniref:HAD family hydrolase n=1 Tax=Paramesorhizobium deserti TaxID=1494590 RepID=A0A135HS26_9HYPH|nr:HAD family hydrolase [Paramesorhizobium deserti]
MEAVDLARLIDLYDVFFIDQFGVLRDDERAYGGAAAGLRTLKDAGKTVVIFSNSGRSGDYNARRLESLGFSRGSFDHFVTSGDVAYSLLSSGELPVEISGETRIFTVSSGADVNLADRLQATNVADPASADIVIIAGSEAERIPLSRYRDLLAPAASRGIPCICTNPDIHKLAEGGLVPAAGAIANVYEELGGNVVRVGKPYLPMYRYAQMLCGMPGKNGIVCIGDSLDHDIRGANDFGADGVLVRTGILATLTEQELTRKIRMKNAMPRFLMTAFR